MCDFCEISWGQKKRGGWWEGEAFEGREEEREREKGAWNRGIQEKLGVDTGPSIPRRVETFNASLELGWTARRKGDGRAEIEFPGIFRSEYVHFTLSVSSFYALRLARKSVIFHDIFFATKKRRPLRVVAGRESFSCASEISNEKTLRREEGRIFRSLELILNRLLKI